MPGLVDTHVHVNEPGRTDWEGFETATRAAAAGGVTTLLDMPLNSDPGDDERRGARAKTARGRSGKTWVDVGFIGGVVPGNASALGDARPRRRARLQVLPRAVGRSPSSRTSTQPDLREAMPVLAELGLPAHGARRAAGSRRSRDARGHRRRSGEVRDLSGIASGRCRARGGRARDRAGGDHAGARAHRARLERADGAHGELRARTRRSHLRRRRARTTSGSTPTRFPMARPSTSARRRFATSTTATVSGRALSIRRART